jgi:protein-tyrosine phosphatase
MEEVRNPSEAGPENEQPTVRSVVFICTGNTCRSPLAEVLCKKRLAESLGCSPEELPSKGFLICSAGLSAFPGDSAAEYAQELAHEYGMDLSGHCSQPLLPELAARASQLVCMTRGHLDLLTAYYPELGCTPRLLNPEGQDLMDPIGQDESVYRDCAARIWSDLEPLARELLAITCSEPPHERGGT